MQRDEVKLLIMGVTILSAFIFTAVWLECIGQRQTAYMVLIMGWTINLMITILSWAKYSLTGVNK